MNVNLSVEIAGIKFPNPIWTASGCFGFGESYHKKLALASGEVFDNNNLGAIVTKTIFLKPRTGHPPERTCETSAGMLNAIGLQGPGLEGFIKQYLPTLRQFTTPLIVSIGANSLNDFSELTLRLSNEPGIAALEVNISCPNMDTVDEVFFCDEPVETYDVISIVRKSTKLPIFVKLSPNVTDITFIGRAAEEAGADALCAINTLRGMLVDWNTGKPLLSNVSGGLSGPAIMPVALYMVYQLYRAVKIPVIGMGGIASVTDVVQFLNCGARAVQVGMQVFVDPWCLMRLPSELQTFCQERGIEDANCLVGKTHEVLE